MAVSRVLSCVPALALAACLQPSEPLAEQRLALARSTSPPGGLAPSQVPQLVAVTFDDNFSSEGMTWATGFYAPLVNPAGSGNAATFDGAPVRTTFYHNSLYLSGAQASWQAAFNAGHEAGDHTVNHSQGLTFSASQWTPEVANCRSALQSGLGATAAQIAGFRAPYLAYNDALYGVLASQTPPFGYDTSIQSCWATGETAASCPWPYTLDSGSPDAATVVAKFGSGVAQPVGAHAGFWEVPVAALVVPPDSAAGQYGFPSGLRARVQNALAGGSAPSFYEPSSGKIAGLDITLIVDARMTRAEATATLKYSLDQHLAGNRSPFVFVAHTHVYASGYGAAVNVPNVADRRAILEDFVRYALQQPVVRMRPVVDLLAWVRTPVALGGVCTPSCSGRECGGDGCGGSCGSCSGGEVCSGGQCVASCTPSCAGRVCGGDGCGGSCGTCGGGQTCTAAGQCQSSGGNCGAPAWSAQVSYAAGAVVTSVCSESIPGTACYGVVGTMFAWRCTNPAWCSLRPGSNQSGWWAAWEALQSCP
jgi:hypothetical protein